MTWCPCSMSFDNHRPNLTNHWNPAPFKSNSPKTVKKSKVACQQCVIYDFILKEGKMAKTKKMVAERRSWREKETGTQRYKNI